MSGSNSSNPAAAPARPPEQPLGLTVHSQPSADTLVDDTRRRSGRLKMLFVVLMCAAPVLASYFTFYVVKPGGGGAAYGTLVHPSVQMPDLTATDLAGRPVALATLRQQWLIVAVNSGDCAPACEQRLFMQRQLREMVGRERDRIDKLWLVTDDAPIATPLRTALEATPAMHILRLPRAAVAAWLAPAAGQALDDHLYIVDPMGRWMMRMPPNADPGKVKRDLDRLLRAASSWDQAGRPGAPTAP